MVSYLTFPPVGPKFEVKRDGAAGHSNDCLTVPPNGYCASYFAGAAARVVRRHNVSRTSPRLAASHRSSATWTTRGREAVGRGYCQRWSHSSNAKDDSPLAPFHRCALSTRRFYTTCGRNCASDLWLAMRMARSCIPPLLFSERNPPNVAQCLQYSVCSRGERRSSVAFPYRGRLLHIETAAALPYASRPLFPPSAGDRSRVSQWLVSK